MNNFAKKSLIILVLFILIGLFLRIYPFDIRLWVMDCDAQIVSQALDLGQGIVERDFSLWLKPVKYPYFIPYLLLFCYGTFYLIGGLMGLFSSANQFINFIFLNISGFYWYGRILIGLFGVLSIPLAYLIVRQFFYKSKENRVIWGSLLAAFLVTFSLISIQFSQQVRPHIPFALLILLTFYFYLLFLKNKKFIYFILVAISAGLAIGSFHGGAFAFVFLILAHYFGFEKKSQKIRLSEFVKSFFSRRFIIGLIIFLVITLLCYPYIFANLEAEAIGGSNTSLALAGASFVVDSFGWGIITIFRTLFSNELALGGLLVIFLSLYIFKCTRFARRESSKEKDEYFCQASIGWWAFVISYAFIFILLDDGTRYRLLIPLILFLCVGAAVLFVKFFDIIKEKKWIILLIVILLLFEIVQAFRFVQLAARPYTRDQAAEWINKNISSTELVVFQKIFPNLIPTKESIKGRALLRSGSLSRQDQFLLLLDDPLYFEQGKTMLDFSEINEYKENNIFEAHEFIKKSKPVYFVLTSRTMADQKQSFYPEYQLASYYGKKVAVFTPFKNKQSSRGLTFPSGLDNPIIDLWAIDRLGPTIEIYKLNWENE